MQGAAQAALHTKAALPLRTACGRAAWRERACGRQATRAPGARERMDYMRSGADTPTRRSTLAMV